MDAPMIIDKGRKVVLGNSIRVSNIEKKHRLEADVYICIQVESEDGKEEYPILLTPSEYIGLSKTDAIRKEGMVSGRVYTRFFKYKNFYVVRLTGYDDEDFVAVIDIADWKKFYERALKHPNSCTKKGMLTDLLD